MLSEEKRRKIRILGMDYRKIILEIILENFSTPEDEIKEFDDKISTIEEFILGLTNENERIRNMEDENYYWEEMY